MDTPTQTVTGTPHQENAAHSTTTSAPTGTSSPQPTQTSTPLPPEQWQDWPVIPEIPDSAREIYQQGLEMGNDPRAFSVLGDCQSLPEIFLGVYDTRDYDLEEEFLYLEETIRYYRGSFGRSSPTVKNGATAGAILWEGWVESDDDCQYGETPLECELRIHNPSIVLIHLGTHWETRNEKYVRKIIETLIELGVVPVLSTKGDNREGDNRLNYEMTALAVEYDLPLWNFWGAVQGLENGGIDPYNEEFKFYLTEEGLARQRISALQVLDALRKELP
jgi:hypothetical protein